MRGCIIRSFPLAQRLLTHPTVLAAIEDLFGGSCKRFRTKVATLIDIGPGETAQPLHRRAPITIPTPPLAFILRTDDACAC
jgi:hypothetical protein